MQTLRLWTLAVVAILGAMNENLALAARPLLLVGLVASAVCLMGCHSSPPAKPSDAYDPSNNSIQHKPKYFIQATIEDGEMADKTQPGVEVAHGDPPSSGPELHPWADPTMDTLPTGIAIAQSLADVCEIPDAKAFFSTDSAELQPEAQAALTALAECFMTGPMKGHRLSVTGHADPRGSDSANMELGWQRAAAVAQHLEAAGLAAQEMEQQSAGETEASEDPAMWPYDRKVVLDISVDEGDEAEGEGAGEGDDAAEE